MTTALNSNSKRGQSGDRIWQCGNLVFFITLSFWCRLSGSRISEWGVNEGNGFLGYEISEQETLHLVCLNVLE